jgi:hypothetical protein
LEYLATIIRKEKEIRGIHQAGHQWLTLVILATWEAKMERINVQGQPGQIVHKTYFQNNHTKMD